MMGRMTVAPHLDPANPFAAASELPYGLPDFSAITVAHYAPAIRAGIAAERAEVDAIAANPEPPTIENTIEALERSGALLHRALTVFYNVSSADSSDELDAIEEELTPELSAHQDYVAMEPRLFAKVSTIAEQIDAGELEVDPATEYLVREMLRDFRRSGVALPEAEQEELRSINARLAELGAKFGRILLAATNEAAVLIDDVADLEGLPEDAVAAAAQAAADAGHAGGYLIELQLPTQQGVLAQLARRDVRARVHEASVTRGLTPGEHDTRPVLLEIVALRAKRARLLGYDHHAAYIAEDGTARTTDAIMGMFEPLAPKAVANAKREAADLQRAVDADTPGEQLRACDWAYYAEQVRRERYSLDDSLLRPYLELTTVLEKGVFAAATALFGVTFERRADLLGYHPDVRVWEVFDGDGRGMGLFLGDFYTRPSKRGGAWMNNLVDQSTLLGELPVVVNNLNIPKPPPGEPTLLAWDEVITMFHEFGHALHGLFSAVRLPSQSGTEVPRDFVEYPSQVNEMWAWEPSLLAEYAVHHKTGEPMPTEWVETLIASRLFNEGFGTTEYLAAALLDQAWHQLAPEDVPASPADVEAFEREALERLGLDFAPVPPRYRTSYFNHIFAGGYSAGYYSYLWSEVLDADTVQWFEENGGLRRENGDAFRAHVLSIGGSQDPVAAFSAMRGRAPSIDPLLARRGLAGETA